jgi:hypothetical protein
VEESDVDDNSVETEISEYSESGTPTIHTSTGRGYENSWDTGSTGTNTDTWTACTSSTNSSIIS